jgi:hypothetical protein
MPVEADEEHRITKIVFVHCVLLIGTHLSYCTLFDSLEDRICNPVLNFTIQGIGVKIAELAVPRYCERNGILTMA